MKEYEDTALQSLQSLKEAHEKELQEFRENLWNHYLIGNRPVNKKVIELKNKEEVYLKVKKYKKAALMKKKWEKEETKEISEFMRIEFKQILKREEKKLKARQ